MIFLYRLWRAQLLTLFSDILLILAPSRTQITNFWSLLLESTLKDKDIPLHNKNFASWQLWTASSHWMILSAILAQHAVFHWDSVLTAKYKSSFQTAAVQWADTGATVVIWVHVPWAQHNCRPCCNSCTVDTAVSNGSGGIEIGVCLKRKAVDKCSSSGHPAAFCQPPALQLYTSLRKFQFISSIACMPWWLRKCAAPWVRNPNRCLEDKAAWQNGNSILEKYTLHF